MRWHPQGVSPDLAWHGKDRRGRAGRGPVRPGGVKADDLSTEGLGPLCWVLRNSDAAKSGRVCPGVVRRCQACSGEAWLGKDGEAQV